MKLFLESIPNTIDYDRLESHVSSYEKTFTLKALDPQQSDQSTWNATLSIPHRIRLLMLIELLDKDRISSGTISIKILEEANQKT